MEASRRVQGRTVTDKDIKTIRSIIASNPNWHRTRISQELCHLWNWKNGDPNSLIPAHHSTKTDEGSFLALNDVSFNVKEGEIF